MKKMFIILFFIGLNFSQSTTLSLFGVGEKYGVTDVSTIALGNSTFFSGNKYNISTNSTSSLWRSALTRFTIYSRMHYITNPKIPTQYEQNLTFFSLSFPIGNKKVIGLGIQPAFRTNKIEIEETIQSSGDDANFAGIPFAYNNKYIVEGGISKVFLQYSQKAVSNFSFGFQYSYLFGNQFLNDFLYIYEVELETIESITNMTISHQFAGSEILIEGRYTTPKQEWVVRSGFNGKTKVRTEIKQFPDYLSKNTSRAKLSEVTFGYLYQVSDYLGILSEFHLNYPFNVPEAVALFNIMPPKETSIHFGTYYKYVNPKIGLWNNLNIRGGAYLKELDFTGETFFDYGATFGIGIEYLRNTQSIDLALRAGKKESILLDGEYEEYISFHVGITTGEKWFMKRRRK